MLLTTIIFIFGYILITAEQVIRIDKAAIAMVTGVLCWVSLLPGSEPVTTETALLQHLAEISGILFFLLGAMTIVELIDSHGGFTLITTAIKTRNRRKLIWLISLMSFILSAALDNLTTTIVMISLTRSFVPEKKDRWLFAGMIIIAANAGGAWSPIGDVTTTMLWIGGQITAGNIIIKLLLPSLACILVPLLLVSPQAKGEVSSQSVSTDHNDIPVKYRNLILATGLGILVLIPVFKGLTGLPPFIGMLLGLGILWIIVEILHRKNGEAEKNAPSVSEALRRIDTPSILFFLGILLAVTALESAGILGKFAGMLDQVAGPTTTPLLLGVSSAIVDNVPLVAATTGMYDLNHFPPDHFFWEFIAYCTGTGGSLLIVGSAAGVAAMGLEDISFGWYLKKISWLALAGYLAGAGIYLLLK